MTAEPDNLDKNNQNEDVVSESSPVAGPTPGELLRAAREKRNLEPRDIAERLRLRTQIIQFIEDDEYEEFASATFIRGYLRSYSRILEIDETQVLAAYDRLGYEAPATIDMQSFSRRKATEKSDSRLMLISYAILVVVIGLAILWWWQEPDFQFSDLNSSSPTEQELSVDAERDEMTSTGAAQVDADEVAERLAAERSERQGGAEPILEEDIEASDVSTSRSSTHPVNSSDETGGNENNSMPDGSSATEGSMSQPVVIEPLPELDTATTESQNTSVETESEPETASNQQPENAEPAPTEPAQQAAGELVLTFSAECWVRVDDATGETIAIGTKAEGYRMPLNGEAPYSVTLCEPDVVSINYAGEEFDMSQFRRGRVARFTIPSE